MLHFHYGLTHHSGNSCQLPSKLGAILVAVLTQQCTILTAVVLKLVIVLVAVLDLKRTILVIRYPQKNFSP